MEAHLLGVRVVGMAIGGIGLITDQILDEIDLNGHRHTKTATTIRILLPLQSHLPVGYRHLPVSRDSVMDCRRRRRRRQVPILVTNSLTNTAGTTEEIAVETTEVITEGAVVEVTEVLKDTEERTLRLRKVKTIMVANIIGPPVIIGTIDSTITEVVIKAIILMAMGTDDGEE